MTDIYKQAAVFHVAGADAPDYFALYNAGFRVVLEQVPGSTAILADARSNGLRAGTWHVPNSNEQPVAFARRVSQDINTYNPTFVMLDIEFIGKGYAGSPGWNWSELMMAEYRRLRPTRWTAVTVMPRQDDFNYGAYTSRGCHVYPQCYGSELTDAVPPDQCADRVVANGVDRKLVHPVAAAGQSVIQAPLLLAASTVGFAVYRSDYMHAADFDLYGGVTGNAAAAYL